MYKIGRTVRTPRNRFYGYPKGSEVVLVVGVDDCIVCEKCVKASFDKKFIHRNDIGREYYEGSVTEMKKEIFRICEDQLTEDVAPIINTSLEGNLADITKTQGVLVSPHIRPWLSEFVEENLVVGDDHTYVTRRDLFDRFMTSYLRRTLKLDLKVFFIAMETMLGPMRTDHPTIDGKRINSLAIFIGWKLKSPPDNLLDLEDTDYLSPLPHTPSDVILST